MVELSYVESLVSKQTGYIHLYKGKHRGSHDTIPILENLCYVYALLKSRNKDNVYKAKHLLSKLISFQDISGNFPVYIHEYPHCRSIYLSLYLLPVFYWIRNHTYHLLGKDLLDKLDSVVDKLFKFAKQSQDMFSKPYKHLFLAIASVYGHAFNSSKFIDLEKDLLQDSDRLSTNLWEKILLSYQLIEDKCSSRLLQKAKRFFHKDLDTYIGPCLSEYHYKFEPNITFFDLFFKTTKPKELCSIYLLKPFIHKEFSFDNLYQSYENSDWMIVNKENFSLFACKKPVNKKKAHLLRILWKAKDRVHSLACFDKALDVQTKIVDDVLTMILTLPDQEPSDDALEVSLFIDRLDDNQLYINDKKATSFNIDDTVILKSIDRTFFIKFMPLTQGCKFWGHLFMDNRPNQAFKTNDQRFDWRVALRTIARPAKAKVQLQIVMK